MMQNPYPVYKFPPAPSGFVGVDNPVIGWKWHDETGQPCETTYKTQRKALRGMLSYMDWLDNGPNLWQRVWWPIRYKLWPLIVKFVKS